jgi:hypothetical protein
MRPAEHRRQKSVATLAFSMVDASTLLGVPTHQPVCASREKGEMRKCPYYSNTLMSVQSQVGLEGASSISKYYSTFYYTIIE